MLYELLLELKNFFDERRFFGTYTIRNNDVCGNFVLKEGQYFRIIGSTFNDGVYCYDENLKLKDETFSGALWALAIPDSIIKLSNDIKEWNEKYSSIDSANMSPYRSESFGGYSYSKDGGGSEDGSSGTWQKAFSSRLKIWRKI